MLLLNKQNSKRTHDCCDDNIVFVRENKGERQEKGNDI